MFNVMSGKYANANVAFSHPSKVHVSEKINYMSFDKPFNKYMNF